MNCRKIAALPVRHKLMVLQIVCLILSVFCPIRPQPLAVVIYCMAVFIAPILLFSYGCQYMCSRKSWLREYVLFFLELLFSVFYVGGMVCRIQSGGNCRLYATLLATYLVISLFCALYTIEDLATKNCAGTYSCN